MQPFMIDTAAILCIYLAYMYFATKRSLSYLHIYQQEEYNNSRFLQWLFGTKAFDTKLTLVILILGVLWFFLPALLSEFLIFVAFAATGFVEKDPRTESKKKLVMTPRARRILFVALAVSVVMGLWCFLLHIPFIWIVNIQLMPFFLLVANLALSPYENYVQKNYWDEAHKKLMELKPTIIGITGSFGKTSVKHILGHILKAHAPTLITPGSVNTPMGVTRIIREQLEDSHKFFVVEMGAYGPGSIERLCRLAPPDMGIITAVGHAHYERFKTIESVAKAKFELAQAVIDKKGKMIVHERPLEIEYAMGVMHDNRDSFIVVGETPLSNAVIERAEQLPEGIRVFVRWNGDSHKLEAPLYGLHHAHNMALAFVGAVTLGIPAENAVIALKSVPQITHRLEVKKPGDGTTLIDDAFNSNPVGFSSALDLLPVLARQGRKILITPGMVELGEAHAEEHEKIGKKAGEVCDVVIIVQGRRIPTFKQGVEATGNGKTIVEVDTFQQASAWLDQHRKMGDVILIENDLPDIYERRLKI